MLTRMPILTGISLPPKFFWDAQQDAHRGVAIGMPMPTSAPVLGNRGNGTTTMAKISPSSSTAAPSLGAHSQVILPLIHRYHPSHSPSTHLFLIIPASLGWYFVSCRGGRTRQEQGNGTVEMASPSFPVPCSLWGRPAFGGQ